jgi:hypothetical protein
MGELEKRWIQERLLQNTSEGKRHSQPLHAQPTPLFGATYHSDNIRTLKAVYRHFADAKHRLFSRGEERAIADNEENMTEEELRWAMIRAKSTFQMMKEVQQQLNQAYKELILAASRKPAK